MKIPSDDDGGGAEARDENLGDELVRAHRGERGAETNEHNALEPEPGANSGFVLRRRQAKDDRPPGKKVRGMRLEGQYRAGGRSLPRHGDRPLNDRLMPEMQAVKISDGVNRTLQPGRRLHRVRGEHEAVGRLRPADPRALTGRSPGFGARANCPCLPIRSTRGMLRLWRRGNAEDAFSVKDDLIADAALAMQSDAASFLRQLDNLHADVDVVPDFDRSEKAQGLRDIRRRPVPAGACR